MSPPDGGPVSRPAVSVVMPFAGDVPAAQAAAATLLSLERGPSDELILADNTGVAASLPGIEVVAATAERSPAHARNAGAERAHGDWILFLDADCRAPRALLDAYFAEPVADDVGVLAGEVRSMPAGETLVQRYGAARGFLSQRAHLEHPFRPRAVAANLLVRRTAFEQVGGFLEGLRAAEDTDFSWRIQDAGWRLELRPGAWVEHRYRTTLSDLRAQWRGYAAGRAWLARRYQGFEPKSGLRRALERLTRRAPPRASRGGETPSESASPANERVTHAVLDGLLAFEELAGLLLPNRPRRAPGSSSGVILVADRFPVQGDPLLDLARGVDGARIEATARPSSFSPALARGLRIDYREDDGAAARVLAACVLIARHPVRCALDRVRRRPGEPTLVELAPAVRRLRRDRGARVQPLGGEAARSAADRLAALAGRRSSPVERG